MNTNKVILLVEDNPDDVELTRLALTEKRMLNELVIARDGEEALKYLFDTNGKGNVLPHLVLLDLNLPKLDGLEVLKRLRANVRTRFLPVVILTSSKEAKDVLSGYSLGCNSYIQKPVDFAQFMESIVQLCMYWLALNISAQAEI